jgi:hypothetical protein
MKKMSKAYSAVMIGNAMKDASKFLRRSVRNIDFDRERWLRRAGLTTYRPARATFGSISFFVLGCLAGGIAALALAPKRGSELRSEVKDKAMELIQRAQGQAATSPSLGSPSPISGGPNARIS